MPDIWRHSALGSETTLPWEMDNAESLGVTPALIPESLCSTPDPITELLGVTIDCVRESTGARETWFGSNVRPARFAATCARPIVSAMLVMEVSEVKSGEAMETAWMLSEAVDHEGGRGGEQEAGEDGRRGRGGEEEDETEGKRKQG